MIKRLGSYYLLMIFSLTNIFCENLIVMIDADFSNFSQSSKSIAMGIETAFSEVNHRIQGRKVILKKMDHRGNSKRSKRNIKKYLKDPRALVMFSGMHSPPLLKNKTLINKEGVLYLDPWASAASITRTTAAKNWIFRLSIDDRKAGDKLVHFLSNTKKLKSPHLVLENTGWGKSNYKNLILALKKYGLTNYSVNWFDWNISQIYMSEIFKDISRSKSDSVIFVGTPSEGANFCKMMSTLDKDQRIPIISHWGITGGNFPIVIDRKIRSKIDLSFLQTAFSFTNPQLNNFQQEVFVKAKSLFPNEFADYKSISAPVGFIHGYDLTKLLIQGLSELQLTNDGVMNRRVLRDKLESISNPVQGLIKRYKSPFHSDSNDLDYHEALDIDNYSMGTYGLNNEVVLIE